MEDLANAKAELQAANSKLEILNNQLLCSVCLKVSYINIYKFFFNFKFRSSL